MPLHHRLNSLIPQLIGPLGRLPLGRLPLARRVITEAVIAVLANATTPRPRPFSLWGDYTSWPGLTDRSFTGRHLPPAAPGAVNRPDPSDVLELFRRPEGGEVPSTDTSVLFMFFAQWFTDSFLRTDRNDFRKNTSTQEIDFCQIYGLTEAKTSLLREMTGGRLKSQDIDGEEYPPFLLERADNGEFRIKREFEGLHDPEFLMDILLRDVPQQQKELLFAVGLEHGNSTVGSTALNVIFLREHNRIAAELEEEYSQGKERPQWERPMDPEALDERLFQLTRNIMIVLLLKLVVEEYIRHIAPHDLPLELLPGISAGKNWDKSNRIAVEFNLLYRWHSMVPETIATDEGQLNAKEFLRDNNEVILVKGLEWLITQCSKTRAGKVCLENTPTFLLERKHPEWPAVEERTISLMRDARLASYNAYRRRFRLPALRKFSDLTKDTALQQRLEDLYGDIDELEWYVGIFAEDYPATDFSGELLTTMVGYDAFTQALTNPLLAKTVFNEATFSKAGMKIIRDTKSLQQIVSRNVRHPTEVVANFKC